MGIGRIGAVLLVGTLAASCGQEGSSGVDSASGSRERSTAFTESFDDAGSGTAGGVAATTVAGGSPATFQDYGVASPA